MSSIKANFLKKVFSFFGSYLLYPSNSNENQGVKRQIRSIFTRP